MDHVIYIGPSESILDIIAPLRFRNNPSHPPVVLVLDVEELSEVSFFFFFFFFFLFLFSSCFRIFLIFFFFFFRRILKLHLHSMVFIWYKEMDIKSMFSFKLELKSLFLLLSIPLILPIPFIFLSSFPFSSPFSLFLDVDTLLLSRKPPLFMGCQMRILIWLMQILFLLCGPSKNCTKRCKNLFRLSRYFFFL